MSYNLDAVTSTLRVNDSGFSMDMLEALKGGTVDWSTTAVSEVRLDFEDRRRQIIGSGLVWPARADGTKTGSIITVGKSRFETRAIEHALDGTLVVTARSELAMKLRRTDGTNVAAGVSPTRWIGQVVNKAGGRFHGQDSPVRDQITRQSDETDWDVIQRLAKEEGYLAFEVDGVVSFGKPTWLIKRPGYGVLNVDIETEPTTGIPRPVEPRILTRPAPRYSADGKDAVCEWDIEVVPEFARGLGGVGFGAKLTGYFPFNGTYLVNQLTMPMSDVGSATISASTPVDPEPQPPNANGTGAGATSRGAISVPPAGKYGGVNLSGEQLSNATAIIRKGLAMGVNERGLIISIMTAAQESMLKNLNYGDRDSLGLFQQRPSMGWGSAAQVRDPQYAAGKFFEGLLKVRGWESMPLTAAAQAVQRSAFPSAYAKWEGMARAVVTAVLATAKTTTAGGGGLSAGTSGVVARVLAAARSKIGLPYGWGATGPNAYDCSSLVQMAWRQGAGIDITRTTYSQLANPRLQKISAAQLQPGDLVYPHNGHVMLYSGNGRVIEAQKPGTRILEGPRWGAVWQARRVPH